MSNTPFFDALLAEYNEETQKELRSTMSTPFLTPAVKIDLPKRNFARLIQPPSVDSEFAKRMQELIQSARAQMQMYIPDASPMGEYIKSLEITSDEKGQISVEAEVESSFNSIKPKLAWVDELMIDEDEDDDVYITPSLASNPILIREFKAEAVPTDLAQHQLDEYRRAFGFAPQRAVEPHDDRFAPPMTDKTMPSWIADEVRESNEHFSDPEPVEDEVQGIRVKVAENIHPWKLEGSERGLPGFFEDLAKEFSRRYPSAQNVSIHRENEIDGTITISVVGTIPEQTDESVNAASSQTSNPAIVKPLWVANEE